MAVAKHLISGHPLPATATLAMLLAASLTACGDTSRLTPGADVGATPTLMSPFGMALVGKALFIANAYAPVKVPYEEGQTSISATPVEVVIAKT
ncbi:hypothetical protein [Polaromonas sp. A23]|uniref:hypothetical protein n=1 Tax=Polaromonas sp. A23 TaxID=1944133 RepID=UPI000987BC70|nr:hypothetical protein [Polaromonas sp. A23]OOG43822.1 hypothetical protein B0B52_07805 [Polaromonas sp. A23]